MSSKRQHYTAKFNLAVSSNIACQSCTVWIFLVRLRTLRSTSVPCVWQVSCSSRHFWKECRNPVCRDSWGSNILFPPVYNQKCLLEHGACQNHFTDLLCSAVDQRVDRNLKNQPVYIV